VTVNAIGNTWNRNAAAFIKLMSGTNRAGLSQTPGIPEQVRFPLSPTYAFNKNGKVSLYLTFVETREQQMDKRHTAWWLQLTFLLHFAGYLALRGWTFYRRRHSTA
jgi:hypothetical protein